MESDLKLGVSCKCEIKKITYTGKVIGVESESSVVPNYLIALNNIKEIPDDLDGFCFEGERTDIKDWQRLYKQSIFITNGFPKTFIGLWTSNTYYKFVACSPIDEELAKIENEIWEIN